jgi:adenine-specific DNA methylase
MLLALLLPDPCDASCPAEFREKASALLSVLPGKPGPTYNDLRQALLRFIGDFANWDLSANPTYVEIGRELVQAAYGDESPLVVDPFTGAGSIPLEALRVGCEAFASDLNPVACLIVKVMLEGIPRYGSGLVENLKQAGAKIKQAVEKELSEFYPIDPDGCKPIAYLWARTVRCEAPNCGAELPLIRSFWLCKKANRKLALRFKVARTAGKTPRIEFTIFQPTSDMEVATGNVSRARATCLCCNTVLPPERVRAQLAEQHGGADVTYDDSGGRVAGARILAVITLKPGDPDRCYRLAMENDYRAILNAQRSFRNVMSAKLSDGLSPIPDEHLPPIGTLGFRVQRYGVLRWQYLFTARQALALAALGAHVREVSHGKLPNVVQELLAFVVNKFARHCNGNARWNNVIESVEPAFGSQTLPITWMFPESVPWGPWAENYDGSLEAVQQCIKRGFTGITRVGEVYLADAAESPLPDGAAQVWFTDPPYYDAVPYADLSDFFFVWLKRSLPNHPLLHDPFEPSNSLTPKAREIVQDESKMVGTQRKNRKFFETNMALAFAEGHRVLSDSGVGCVVFAHKTTEGWEALLSGMIQGGWTVTASWPIATERAGRLRARESAALSASIHLVCRPRPENAPIGDWSEVLRDLPKRVGDWMERLQQEHVRGADLVFACIGPALEIFSRYSRVETAEGTEVTLAEYLQKVWEVVGRAALEQVLGTSEAQARNGTAGALEEDARLTALFLWTLQSTNDGGGAADKDDYGEEGDEDHDDEEESGGRKTSKGFSLIFDVARRFAQPLGIHLREWEGRIIETKKGIVRLLAVSERAEQLFGKEGAQTVAERIERTAAADVQGMLFPEMERQTAPRIGGRRRRTIQGADTDELRTTRAATTLDRVHAAMLLQAGGRSNALRALLKAEQERSPDFLRLANALSALYPRTSEEKRLLDAMLLAVPR